MQIINIEKNFAKDVIKIGAQNTGMGRLTWYDRVYCDHCHKNLVPEVLKHEFFKEFEIPSLKDLIDNWDDLILTLILWDASLCKEVHAGPSARCFRVRPIEHLQVAHPYTH